MSNQVSFQRLRIPREPPINRMAREYRQSAERADIRNEPALALLFRNAAWRIENGREWLDDAAIKKPAA